MVVNLNKKLAKDDPCWLAFGLELPSTQTTPAAPTGFRATVMGSEVLLECDATPYATRYRWRSKIVGLDSRPKLAASTRDPMATLEGVAAGLLLEIYEQAVNGPSQSVPSNPILVTMPANSVAVPKSEEAKPEAAAFLPEMAANGNGNESHIVSRLG